MMVNLGSTANFVVNYDDSIDTPAYPWTGQQMAQSVLDFCEYDYARLTALFGTALPAANLPITINITPGAGGANNNGMNIINATPNTNVYLVHPDGLNLLIVEEEAEIFMNAQNNKGWMPAWSNGEALSRVSAQILYPDNAWLTYAGDGWYNPNTHTNPPDWIDNVEQTDQDQLSYGCGTLYLNYLAYQLNILWATIIQAGAPATNTLAETANLSGAGQNGTFGAFVSQLQANFPNGQLYSAATPLVERTDDVYPLGPAPAQVPVLYMRHNTADDGTSHAPPLSMSPDIIMKNAAVANPQAVFSTPASIASATESDPYVVGGQPNYLYLRVWNRGPVNAQNVFASVYWSPPATLVTPSMWNLLGASYFPAVPSGSNVEVTTIGIPWSADLIPAPGHYCFVAVVGNNYQPAPNPAVLSAFATFNDYVNYIANNNNITWRNFNVGPVSMFPKIGGLRGLPFLIAGAWNGDEIFQLEVVADLPEGSKIALQTAEWVGRALRPAPRNMTAHRDLVTDIANPNRLRIPLPANDTHALGDIRLPGHSAVASHMLVHIPPRRHDRAFDVLIRQLYRGQEIGRVTWRLLPGE